LIDSINQAVKEGKITEEEFSYLKRICDEFINHKMIDVGSEKYRRYLELLDRIISEVLAKEA
jgi:hypothetical protein